MIEKSPDNFLRTDKYDYSFDPLDRSSVSIIAAQIPQGSSVLEFGPAHGRLTRYLKQHLGCRVFIVEIDAVAAQEASRYADETMIGDAMDYGWLEKFGQERFDAILFADVLEHLQNPWEVLSRAVGLLNDDGWIWISIPNVAHNAVLIDLFNDRFRYRQDGLLDATHIRFFTKESLEEMILASGLYPVRRSATVCSVPQTELGNCYEHVPPGLADLLKKRNGGEIYQYVFGCVRQSCPVRGSIQECHEVDLLPGVTAQLYLDVGEGISEGEVLERTVSYGETSVEFDLSGRGNIRALRFDPCVSKAIIRLFGVQAISKKGSTTVDEERISSNCTSRTGRLFIFDHDDPQFLILFGDKGESLLRIVFDIRYLFVGQQLPYFDAEVIAVGGLSQYQLPSEVISARSAADQGVGKGVAAASSVQVWLYDLVRQKNLALQKLKNELRISQNNQNKLQELEEMLAEREKEIVRQRAVNADIMTSSIWKMGEPLRKLVAGVRNLKSLALGRPAVAERNSASETEFMPQEALTVEEKFFVRLWQGYLHDVQDHVPRLRERVDALAGSPLISLIMSLPASGCGPSDDVSHILGQIYPFWELHTFFPEGEKKPRQDMVDARIHFHAVSESRSFQEALGALLEKIEAPYVLFLDPGTSLTPHALLHVAEVMAGDKPGMLYTDGVVKLNGCGSALSFIFRPAFAPEWLRVVPYIDHLLAMRIDLAKQFGAASASMNGVFLPQLARCVEGQGEEVAHIAEPLYVYVPDSRQGEQGLVVSGWHDSIEERVEFPHQTGVKIAIVIPSKDRGELVQQCIESIEKTTGSLSYGIFVVNHDSTDPITLEYFQRIEGRYTILPYSGSFNFSVINNQAVAMIPSEFTHILFCNNDIEACRPGWLEHLLACCQLPGVGAAGALLLFPDGQLVKHGGVCLGMLGGAEHYGKFLPAFSSETPLDALKVCHEVSAVTAACMLVNRDDFEAVGGYDEEFAIGFGDVDLCLRIGLEGRRILYCPQAILFHHESASRDRGTCDPHPEDTALFYRKWQDAIRQGDPYSNPHYDMHNHHWRPRDPLSYTGAVIVRLTTGQGIVRTLFY